MKRTLRDLAVNGKRVFVRVDFNVPMKDGVITDDTRIRATLPTLRTLLDAGATLILASHLGRPKGKVQPVYSLEPVAKCLATHLGVPVTFAHDCVGADSMEKAAALPTGGVLLLENLRFHPEEEQNDAAFAQQLASLADCYVNDAFGTSHRAHASVAAITKYIPSASGLLLEKEIRFLGDAVENPERPFAAIIGGAKVSDKITVIENLLPKVDTLLIGGGMANTFLAAQGYEMGSSLVEPDTYALARTLIEKAEHLSTRLLLPVDFVIADAFSADAHHTIVAADQVPADWMALDIGPETERLYAEALAPMKTIVWNGPMGVFEMEPFAHGTMAMAEAVSRSEGITIVGGGDSVAALEVSGLSSHITHISTGGGASLEYLEGKTLPGIASLDEV